MSKKNKGGRKGKYRKWLTQDGLMLIEAWARDGYTDVELAEKMGISPSTLYEWSNRFTEIDEAKSRGKEVVDVEVENATFKSATGFYYTEEKQYITEDANGNTNKGKEITKKYQPPNVSAQIWWLKNRKREVWREKPTSKMDEREQLARIEKLEAEAEILKVGLQDPDGGKVADNFIQTLKGSIDVKEIFDGDDDEERL